MRSSYRKGKALQRLAVEIEVARGRGLASISSSCFALKEAGSRARTVLAAAFEEAAAAIKGKARIADHADQTARRLSVQPTSRTVSSMPGIERAAPERTETSNGWRRWPKRWTVSSSRKAIPSSRSLAKVALGILVALHQRGAKVDGQDEGGRNGQPKARNTRKNCRLGPELSRGCASSLAPVLIRTMLMAALGYFDNSLMTWVCSTWPIARAGRSTARARGQARVRRGRPRTRPLPPSTSRVTARSDASAACSRSTRRRGRLKRIFALGAAALALGQALPQPRARVPRPRCRKLPPRKARQAARARTRLGLDGQKRDEKRGLLQLVDRVLRRIDQGGDRAAPPRRVRPPDGRRPRSRRPSPRCVARSAERAASGWRTCPVADPEAIRVATSRARPSCRTTIVRSALSMRRSGARDRPQASRAPRGPNGLGVKPRCESLSAVLTNLSVASRPSRSASSSPKPSRAGAARRTAEAISSAPPSSRKARWPIHAVPPSRARAIASPLPIQIRSALRALFQSMRNTSDCADRFQERDRARVFAW